ncbi:MAG TPA: thiamine-phosphate kinase [Actinotalea caeni]|uniref:thiamine-phosphate kinase n=1 Tax=Actinotalea caeni TaxID=1348467 RepID=UPI0012E265AA|nr:thiamine-phosphate kinase [Actinotalea caeni]HLV55707.1 thiamine-phosphate kinase [Actinotalea caeni]
MSERVGDLDETELIARFAPLLPVGAATVLGPGDDAAVVAAPDARVVVTTDVLVEDRHFRHVWGTAVDLGHRAAAQNLADVAAMGARPTGLVVALVLPPATEVSWVLGLAEGLAAACGPDVGVVGGDLSSGDRVVVAVTAFGSLDGADPVRRDGARPGDVLAHAGRIGWAAAGYAALEAGRAEDAGLAAVVQGFLRPEPPLADGPGAATGGATSLIDVSDGLLRDAGRVARASGVGVDLEGGVLVDPVLRRAADTLGLDPLALALTGGEDHGLLATFPPGAPLPGGFRAVGRVLDAPGVTVDGAPPPVSGVGWDHFRP